MLKIKKGIKKKIKGKKGKNDELFTPEELEQYKREKEEEARKLAAGQEEQSEEVSGEKENLPVDPEAAAVAAAVVPIPEQEGKEEETCASGSQEPAKKKEDWRNFFSATDSVLKKTADNLEHIKEASYFQKKEEQAHVEVEVPEAAVASVTPAFTSSSSGKKWVDLDRGGIDDEEEEFTEEEVKESNEPEPEPEKELAPLQFIEDLPDVDVDDFTEVFDTTYVDNVESGEVKLHYIPDSPTLEDPNEPDPFDTSGVDKVLQPDQPEPPKKSKEQKQEKKPEKKKKKLVSLGCAVDVLTGKLPTNDKPSGPSQTDPKRRRLIPKEVNLLADADCEESVTKTEEEEKETSEESKLTNPLDDILCVTDTVDLPEVGVVLCPTPRSTSPCVLSEEDRAKEDTDVRFDNDIECENKEVDLSEFLESNGEEQDSKEVKQNSGKELDLNDLVAEFDVIDKSEIINETLIPNEPDPIEDEFDAEFAFLAAESVAKSKEKELEDLEDDPFDTSVAAHVLGPDEPCESEKDPFDVSFADGALGEDTTAVKSSKPTPARPAPPKTQKKQEEVDPFDTSVADKILPVDHLASTETTLDLPETLQPHSGEDIAKSESFDPFDTSIAEAFGKTELKVLETELLTVNQGKSAQDLDDDFDFDPRADEVNTESTEKSQEPCLLTSDEGVAGSVPVLTPSQDKQEEEFDPFDTSIAAKVAIQTLTAEFISDTETKEAPPPRPKSPAHIFATTPTDTNPPIQPTNLSRSKNNNLDTSDNFDPFDTSIAENFGRTELKALEDELLTSEPVRETKHIVEQTRPDTKSLDLPVKPLRPPSPKCLLAATPLDENPALQPTLKPSENTESKPSEDFDPFDTSIADQFGKTELKVLESELLVTANSQVTQEFDDFNSRPAVEEQKKLSKPSRPPSPVPPQCLLTATPAGTPPGAELLAPTESKTLSSNENFDPFDTSIAEKFGKTELKQLESELLTTGNLSSECDPFDDFNPRDTEPKKPLLPQKSNRPSRPTLPTAPCLLAATPTDQAAPLQPSLNTTSSPKESITPEDFDPFDTTIAEKLCKTEIKALEESLHNSTEISVSNTLTKPDPDHFLSSPTENLGPTLQPIQSLQQQEAELDPFDTSIADKFGKTELKTLESELLSDSGVKRNLSDDEFDPREEEKRAPQKPPPPVQKPPTPISLLDSAEDTNISDQPIQASQVTDTTELDDYDPFDTSIAANIGPSKQEIKLLESELLSAAQDPFDTSNIN